MNQENKKYKVQSIWTESNEEIFVEIWRRYKKELQSSELKSKAYEKIVHELLELSLHLTPSDVECKIEKLTAKYHLEKTLIKEENGGLSLWPLFNKVQEIVEAVDLDSPVDQNVKVGNNGNHDSDSISSDSSESSSSTLDLSSFEGMNGQIMRQFHETNKKLMSTLNEICTVDKELVAIGKKRLELYQKQVNDATELKNSMLSLLNSFLG